MVGLLRTITVVLVVLWLLGLLQLVAIIVIVYNLVVGSRGRTPCLVSEDALKTSICTPVAGWRLQRRHHAAIGARSCRPRRLHPCSIFA